MPIFNHNGEITCPKCGLPIYGYTAISREDNKTEICNNCGMNEVYLVINFKNIKQD